MALHYPVPTGVCFVSLFLVWVLGISVVLTAVYDIHARAII